MNNSPSFLIHWLCIGTGWLSQLLLTIPLCNLLRLSIQDTMSDHTDPRHLSLFHGDAASQSPVCSSLLRGCVVVSVCPFTCCITSSQASLSTSSTSSSVRACHIGTAPLQSPLPCDAFISPH